MAHNPVTARKVTSANAARLAAIRAIAEYEQLPDKKLSDTDRQLLKRFQSNKWSSKVGSAWLQIQKYLKNSNDGQLVIGDIIRAKHFASTAATQRLE
jgi:hypothetical protein